MLFVHPEEPASKEKESEVEKSVVPRRGKENCWRGCSLSRKEGAQRAPDLSLVRSLPEAPQSASSNMELIETGWWTRQSKQETGCRWAVDGSLVGSLKRKKATWVLTTESNKETNYWSNTRMAFCLCRLHRRMMTTRSCGLKLCSMMGIVLLRSFMIVWTTFHRASLRIFWMVSKVIERGVSFSLFRRNVVRNVDCSNVLQVSAPFFCPVMS